ncbi:hypothetical protein ACCS79_03640 [Rhizobium johnstonii]|uniref:hypothetical protein n=1 Tax=Rhizobium johnstonii TaxID=3019933 RepID=UPI003F950E4E
MARKKLTPDPLLKTADEIDIASASPLDPSTSAIPTERLVTMSQLETLLGYDRNTLASYQKHGMPYHQKADRDRGVPWLFDVAAVVEWLISRSALNAAERLGLTEDGTVSHDEFKRLRAGAVWVIDQVKADRDRSTVAPKQLMLDAVEGIFSTVRIKLGGLADSVAGRVDADLIPVVRGVVDEEVRNLLATLTSANVAKIVGRRT